MPLELEGGAELDGGPLSALSESYFTTHANGMHSVLHLEGRLDLSAFREAVRRVQEEFPVLSSPLIEEKKGHFYYLKRRRLETYPPLTVQECDWDIAASDRREAVMKILRERHTKPFDLFSEPPARFLLLRFSGDRSSFVVNMHHTCADGYVLLSILKSVVIGYDGLVSGAAQIHAALFRNTAEKRTPILPNYRANAVGLLKEMYLRRRHPLIRRPRRSGRPVEPSFGSLVLTADETGSVLSRAKRLDVTVNDLLNVAIIRAIDDVRGFPEGLMAVCLPINLRRYVKEEGRYGNLTSGFYVHLDRRQRLGNVLEAFVGQRARCMREGRAQFHLILLQKMYRLLRFWPQEKRIAWLRRMGGYSATFFCSNLGDIRFHGSTEGGLRVTDYDLLVSPNRHADYSVIALTYNDRLKLSISTDRAVIDPEEVLLFQERLKALLLLGEERCAA